MPENIQFSLVSTVFNEAERLDAMMSDLERQSKDPSEIVITDAGSTDGTYERLVRWAEASDLNIRILSMSGCNVASGRNMAIEQASGPIIVSTDFGCRFHPDWLKSLMEPFEDPAVAVVGGAYTVDAQTIWCSAAKANYILTNGYRIVLDDHFIPSSRSIAFKKAVWQDVGGYDEWLTLAADDLVFGLKLKAKGYHIALVDKPYVYWGRHDTFSAYAKEAFRYGLGDGEARVNRRNTLSLVIETMARYYFAAVLITWIVLYVIASIPAWLLIFLLPGLIGFRPYLNAWKNWSRLRSSKYHFGVFLYSLPLIELTRFQYLKGYYRGFFLSPEFTKSKARDLEAVLQ